MAIWAVRAWGGTEGARRWQITLRGWGKGGGVAGHGQKDDISTKSGNSGRRAWGGREGEKRWQEVALQTTEAMVPGSNPASLTVKNSEDRQRSHCVYLKNLGAERETSP